MDDRANSDASHEDILERARRRAEARGALHAGDLTPSETARLLGKQAITLVDVRTRAESVFVGRVPGVSRVEWPNGNDETDGKAFVDALGRLASDERPIVLSCRSGKRSDDAARAAARLGLDSIYNMLEGFEGEADEAGQRGKINGWRHAGLPWVREEETVL